MIYKLRNIVIYIGIAIALIIATLNIVFQSTIVDNISEHVDVIWQGLLYLLIEILIVLGIIYFCKITQKFNIKNKKTKLIIVEIVLFIYFITQVAFINYRDAYPKYDQLSVYESAVSMYNNDKDALIHSNYLEKYPQQLTLALAECGMFKLFGTTNVKVIQYINAISNCFTVVAIILIAKLITKKKENNLTLVAFSILTYLPLALLSTFVYGDEISIAFSLFSVYFIMKYKINKKVKYALISAILMALSYILRMNNLIFIIAISMYLVFDILKEIHQKLEKKQILIKTGILLMFIVISLMPAKIIISKLQSEYELDPKGSIPVSNFLYMGMTEGYRNNGWYNDYGSWAWDNDEQTANEMYKTAIGERIKEFASHPLYLAKFYMYKTASMWAENTNAAIYYNQSFNFNENVNLDKDNEIVAKKNNIELFMKSLSIVIFGTLAFSLIINRKKMTDEALLLIIILIGGFLFHTIWEAKSRYILPYIVAIIPLLALPIKINERKK